jgi:hypothetical protein
VSQDQLAAAGIFEADLAAGDWYMVPTVRADAILSPLVIGGDDEEPTIKRAQELRRVPVSSGENIARRDGQPLGFSASSVCVVSTPFCLQIGLILRLEQSFGTPQLIVIAAPISTRQVRGSSAAAR